MIYLATPYSHPDPEVKLERFNLANRVAAELIRAGNFVFSPISHSHPIALCGELPGDWEYWGEYCKITMGMCDSVVVITTPGWEESTGVTEEIRIAFENDMMVYYLDLEKFEAGELIVGYDYFDTDLELRINGSMCWGKIKK